MRIELTRDYKRQHMAKAVPGSYWDPEAKMWVVEEPDPRTAAIVLRLFPELGQLHPSLVAERDKLYSDARPFDNATKHNQPIRHQAPVPHALLEAEGFDYYKFQDLDLGYLLDIIQEHGGAYLGWERGLGKTLGAATLIDALGAQRTLVCCPNTAKESVWAAELERFLPNYNVLVMPNPKVKREKMLASLHRYDKHRPLVFVVHYEGLGVVAGTETYTTATGKRKRRVLDGWNQYSEWDLFICDEAHRLANISTIMHKAAGKVPTKMRLALSGSILQNHPEELFGTLNWLFPKSYRRKWADWCDRYVEYVNDGWANVAVGFKADRIEKMRRELGVFMCYRRRSDELDLPERVQQTIMLDLEPKQRKAYNEVLTQFWTVVDNEEVVKAGNVLAQLNLLRRIATGLSTDGQEVTDSSKLDWAETEIQDSDEDAAYVVFSWYKAPLAALQKRLEKQGIECFRVDGDVKQADRALLIDAFQQGQGKVFLGTISTLGESVTLHRANNMIRLDRAWNPSANAQADDRIYRIGQQRTVVQTDLVARDTVDELRVQPILASKESLRRALLGGV